MFRVASRLRGRSGPLPLGLPAGLILPFFLAPTACFEPDVEALQQKLLDECRFAPEGPDCAFSSDDPAVRQRPYERLASRTINSADEQACVLAIDCTDPEERFDRILADVRDCVGEDASFFVDGFPDPNDACEADCDTILLGCAEEEGCALAAVDQCFSEFDECRGRCPPE